MTTAARDWPRRRAEKGCRNPGSGVSGDGDRVATARADTQRISRTGTPEERTGGKKRENIKRRRGKKNSTQGMT